MTEENPVSNKDAAVRLREVTNKNLRTVLGLTVKKEQSELVAPNSWSISEAYFRPTAWFRAIYADDTPVGFVMIDDLYLAGEANRISQREKGLPDYLLWRLMVDGEHQGKGYGFRAMQLVIDHVKSRPNAVEIFTSHEKSEGNAGEFYRKLGFEYTGREGRGGLEMRLVF